MAFQESSRAFKYTNVPQTKKTDTALSGDDCGRGPGRRWDCDEGRIHKNVGEEKMTCASLVIFHFQLLCVKYRMNKCLL